MAQHDELNRWIDRGESSAGCPAEACLVFNAVTNGSAESGHFKMHGARIGLAVGAILRTAVALFAMLPLITDHLFL